MLDGQPWARSWPAFLKAINDPNDSSVRQYIANAAAWASGSGAEGGFLVPEVLRSQVMAYMTRGDHATAGDGAADVVAAAAGADPG